MSAVYATKILSKFTKIYWSKIKKQNQKKNNIEAGQWKVNLR